MTPVSRDGAGVGVAWLSSPYRSQTFAPVADWSVRQISATVNPRAGRCWVGARRAAMAWALGVGAANALSAAGARGGIRTNQPKDCSGCCWLLKEAGLASLVARASDDHVAGAHTGMLAIAPYAAAALVVGLGAARWRCVRASSVRASCAHSLDALESRLRGCAREDVVLLIDFDRTITDGTSAQCHDVVGATECMPLPVREGFAKMLDFSQPFPPELEVVLSGFNQHVAPTRPWPAR